MTFHRFKVDLWHRANILPNMYLVSYGFEWASWDFTLGIVHRWTRKTIHYCFNALYCSIFQAPKLHPSPKGTTAELFSEIGAGFAVVPIIAFLTSIAIAQSFSKKNNYEVNPSQELIALGVANVANSFVSGFPIAGCFSRTTVNSLSGVATPFGGMYSRLWIEFMFFFTSEMYTQNALLSFLQWCRDADLRSASY